MNVVSTPEEVVPSARAVAVGSFDGVHRGHRSVLEATRGTGLAPTVVTFDPHPRIALGNRVDLLTTLERRLELIEEAGIETTLVAPFTPELQQTTPEAFAERYLRAIGTSVVVVGEDFRFGVRRSGDLAGGGEEPAVAALREEFFAALRDDFNTPEALAALFKLVSEGNRRLVEERALPGAATALEEMLFVLGLERMLDEPDEVDEDALRLVQEREDARLARDYERADTARDKLRRRGWEVRDTPEGPMLVPAGS